MKKPPPRFKRIPTPWPIHLLLIVMGPCLLVFTLGMVFWIHFSVREVGEARVVKVINQYDSVVVSGKNDFCPVFEWSFTGRTFRETSKFCGNYGDFEVGQRVEVRFDPENPKKVVPNDWWSMYGFALILLPWSLLISILVIIFFIRG